MGMYESQLLLKIQFSLRNYKNAKDILANSRTNLQTMSAAVVYIHDQTEISHIEIADYRKFLQATMQVTFFQLLKHSFPMLVVPRGSF